MKFSEKSDRQKMEGSGKKLVLLIAGVALVAGGTAWFYQYETTHRATKFWGPVAAPLIARPSQVEIWQFEPPVVGAEALWQSTALSEPMDLSKVRGMVHLRRVLISDQNYLWDREIDPEGVTWRWRLELADERSSALIVLAEGFATVGLLDSKQQRLLAANCQPMAETIAEYFAAIGLLKAEEAASTTR